MTFTADAGGLPTLTPTDIARLLDRFRSALASYAQIQSEAEPSHSGSQSNPLSRSGSLVVAGQNDAKGKSAPSAPKASGAASLPGSAIKSVFGFGGSSSGGVAGAANGSGNGGGGGSTSAPSLATTRTHVNFLFNGGEEVREDGNSQTYSRKGDEETEKDEKGKEAKTDGMSVSEDTKVGMVGGQVQGQSLSLGLGHGKDKDKEKERGVRGSGETTRRGEMKMEAKAASVRTAIESVSRGFRKSKKTLVWFVDGAEKL
jgi:hypothetical protein